MSETAFSRLLAFLANLRSRKIQFRIEQQRDDAIMVSFAVVGRRLEVEFFEDHLEFSTFDGDESVESDENLLWRMVDERWD